MTPHVLKGISMAQHEGAAGGEAVASDSSQPANDPIEALVDEFLGDEDQEDPTSGDGSDPEFDGEDDAGEEPETAIDPPASWKAEERQQYLKRCRRFHVGGFTSTA
jgi:hypothetical protein